jgi:hypothetical protein
VPALVLQHTIPSANGFVCILAADPQLCFTTLENYAILIRMNNETITPIERKRSIEALGIQLSAISLRPFD